MTLKDFLKAWKECAKTHETQHETAHETKAQNANLRRDKTKECECFLRENYGINQADLNEIINEIKDNEMCKWWGEELFEYLLERAENGDENALEIKAKFKIDELNFAELKKLVQDNDFISILWEFWLSKLC